MIRAPVSEEYTEDSKIKMVSFTFYWIIGYDWSWRGESTGLLVSISDRA